MTDRVSIRVDGLEILDDTLSQLALVNYGHFTAMQIRGGQVRGLSLHLARLQSAHSELYGTIVDPAIILDRVREAASDAPDSYLRVTLFESDPGTVQVMTALRPPVAPASAPVALLPVVYQRPAAHIKHVGGFGQLYFNRMATQQGFSDALLTTADGEISETATANIAFIEADGNIIWPSAPSLHGISWQILDMALADAKIRTRKRPVKLTEISRFTGAFVTSSIGVVSVAKIGPVSFAKEASAQAIMEIYDSTPWDII